MSNTTRRSDSKLQTRLIRDDISDQKHRRNRHKISLREWRKTGRDPRSPKYLVISILLFFAYYVSGEFGLRMASLHPSASPVWPDTGIALAAFLLLDYRFWPAILTSSFALYLTTLGAPSIALGIAIGNTAEGLLGAYLVNRFAGGLRFCRHAHSLFWHSPWHR